jgi:cell wall-associated NlpC family hydrolase
MTGTHVPYPVSRRGRWLVLALLVVQGAVLLACEGMAALPAAHSPRWACPSPTPRPTRVKAVIPRPTTLAGIDPGSEVVYYQVWEQEYGLPPMTPTPFTKNGTFYLGQRVEVAPLHALVTAQRGPQLGAEQVQIVEIQWRNAGDTPVAMDYLNRVRVRAVRGDDGAQITSDAWGMTERALAASRLPRPPDEIPPGDSEARLAILTPPGQVALVEILFQPQRTVGATPTPDTAHRAPGVPFLPVQWAAGGQEPPCGDPGVYTNYGDGPQAIANIPAPPGTARVIQIALNQVGKPYVWGAKGPHAFDCSGLTEWSYAQIGIDIPTGTSGQWPRLPAPDGGQLGSGDLLFYDTRANGVQEITHVGLTSDLDGDGDWDLVHAASPEYGVRIDEDVFTRPYYARMYMGARTVR